MRIPLPGLGPESRLGRWVATSTRGRLTPRGLRIATFGLGLALGLGLVALVFAVQVSSTPTFCGTCHIMKPYYESWKHSKHNDIACVDCHISPGITAEVRKKWEALSMVAKYFTGTYSTNPWAEVEDAACLRCHERRLLEGKEVYHSVLFDHTPHLTEVRRGLHLRCTSCHSQIVQGSHISVTTSTCALCHFMGQKPNEGVAACRTCHEIPERVTTTGGVTFDHQQVRTLDMDCRLCHAGVVRGTGAVPRERCLTCHNQPSRLAEYGNKDLLHRMHVTEHKVDCMNCHLQIEHGKLLAPAMAAASAPATAAHAATGAAGAAGAAGSSICESCHGSGHNAQQDLYAGVGGRGVPRTPGPMYLAGVTCQGCHNPAVQADPSPDAFRVASAEAGAVSCMSCHGPAYERIYRSWKENLDARTGALRRQLESTVGAMGLSAPQAWRDAQYNYELVERGHGIHNINFAYALLEKSHDQMNEARRAKGLPALSRPWTTVAPGSASCFSCHTGVERQSGRFGERAFAHAPHLVSAKLECDACHRPHAERAPGEVVRFGAAGCVPCHHTPAAASSAACARCHGDVTQRTVASFRGTFSHKAHLESGLECSSCHVLKGGDPRPERSACAQCHVEG